ncbi:MAG: MlaD family protein [Verrucomicrobiota bacterium]
MPDSKIAWKVGAFVCVSLILLAGLMLSFSRSLGFFEKTYRLRLKAENVGGIKDKAMVMMSGVKVGMVENAVLQTNGSVLINLKIEDRFKIDRAARFYIDSMGFLGDQYVAINSTNSSDYLKDGDQVICDPPLNLQEAMRSTAGLLSQAQATMKTLDAAVSNVNKTVLNEATLTSFSRAISNLQAMSGNVSVTLAKVDSLIDSNSPVIGASISNLYDFTTGLKTTLATNQMKISQTISNLHHASVSVNELLEGVKATNGPVGLLLRDEQMKKNLASLATNINVVAENFAVFSSNLNQRGLWRMLWKPKAEKTSGKDN